MEAEEDCASISPQTSPNVAGERATSAAVNATSFSQPDKHEGLRFAWHGIVRKTSWREDGYGRFRRGLGEADEVEITMINFQN